MMNRALVIDGPERLIPSIIKFFANEMVSLEKEDYFLTSDIFAFLKNKYPNHLKNAILENIENIIKKLCLDDQDYDDDEAFLNSLNAIVSSFDIKNAFVLNLVYDRYRARKELQQPQEFYNRLLRLMNFFVEGFPRSQVNDFMNANFAEIAEFIFNRDDVCENGEHINVIQFLIEHFPDQFRNYIKNNIHHILDNFRTQEEIELLVVKLDVDLVQARMKPHLNLAISYSAEVSVDLSLHIYPEKGSTIKLKNSKPIYEYYWHKMQEIKAFLDEHFQVGPGVLQHLGSAANRTMISLGFFSESENERDAKKAAEENANMKQMPSDFYNNFYYWLKFYLEQNIENAAKNYIELVKIARKALDGKKKMSHFEKIFFEFIATNKYFPYHFAEFRDVTLRENEVALMHGMKNSKKFKTESAVRLLSSDPSVKESPLSEEKILGVIFGFLRPMPKFNDEVPEQKNNNGKDVDGDDEMRDKTGRWDDIGLGL